MNKGIQVSPKNEMIGLISAPEIRRGSILLQVSAPEIRQGSIQVSLHFPAGLDMKQHTDTDKTDKGKKKSNKRNHRTQTKREDQNHNDM